MGRGAFFFELNFEMFAKPVPSYRSDGIGNVQTSEVATSEFLLPQDHADLSFLSFSLLPVPGTDREREQMSA